NQPPILLIITIIVYDAVSRDSLEAARLYHTTFMNANPPKPPITSTRSSFITGTTAR
ncbi:hypothetical protein KXV77_006132, partial [Aspergillus fumigatus]